MSRKKTHKSDYILFAKNISKIVSDNGGKYAVAAALNVVYDSIRRWCKGENLPDGQQLLAIRDKFNVSIDWLFTGTRPYAVPADLINDHRVREHRCEFCTTISEETKEICTKVKNIIESEHPIIVHGIKVAIEVLEDAIKQTEEIKKIRETATKLRRNWKRTELSLVEGNIEPIPQRRTCDPCPLLTHPDTEQRDKKI